MLSVTRQTTPFATALLLVTIAASVARLYLNPFPTEVACSQFMPQRLYAVLSAVLIFISAIIVNRTTVKVGLFSGFSTLPVSIFGFIACGVFISPNLLTSAICALLMAVATIFLMRSLLFLNEKEALFTGAIFLGVMPIIYPPTAIFAAIIPILALSAPLSFRQIIVVTTGYLLPLAAVSYLNWYTGNSFTDVAVNLWTGICTHSTKIVTTPLPITSGAIALVLAMILIYGTMVGIYNRYTMLVPARKAIQITISILIVGILSFIFVPGCGITIIPALAVPATIVCAFALDRMETNWANFFYLLVIGLIIIHLLLY